MLDGQHGYRTYGGLLSFSITPRNALQLPTSADILRSAFAIEDVFLKKNK